MCPFHTIPKPVIEIPVLYNTSTHQRTKGVRSMVCAGRSRDVSTRIPSSLIHWRVGPVDRMEENFRHAVSWEALKKSLRCGRPVLSVGLCVNHFHVDLGEAEGRLFLWEMEMLLFTRQCMHTYRYSCVMYKNICFLSHSSGWILKPCMLW